MCRQCNAGGGGGGGVTRRQCRRGRFSCNDVEALQCVVGAERGGPTQTDSAAGEMGGGQMHKKCNAGGGGGGLARK